MIDNWTTYAPQGTRYMFVGLVVGWLISMLPHFRSEAEWLLRGRCPKCHYDLGTNADAGCPECGWARASIG